MTLEALSSKGSFAVDSPTTTKILSNVALVLVGTSEELLMNNPRKTRASTRKAKEKPVESTEVEIPKIGNPSMENPVRL